MHKKAQIDIWKNHRKSFIAKFNGNIAETYHFAMRSLLDLNPACEC